MEPLIYRLELVKAFLNGINTVKDESHIYQYIDAVNDSIIELNRLKGEANKKWKQYLT